MRYRSTVKAKDDSQSKEEIISPLKMDINQKETKSG